MNRLNKRPSLRTMANLGDYPDKFYLRDLKQNYATRKDNIAMINSYNELASAVRVLAVQLAKSGGDI